MTTQTYYQSIPPLKCPWKAPLSPIDGSNACISHGYLPVLVEPNNQNFIERDLYQLNPDDHEWRTSKKFFSDLPIYITKYFAKRYKAIFAKNGKTAANTYLREKMEPAMERARLVLAQYKTIPTTRKVYLLSGEHNDTEQSNFTSKEQMRFDFDQTEKNRKPPVNRLLAELDQSELKDMAHKIALIVEQYFALDREKYHCATPLGTEMAIVFSYEQVAAFITKSFGVKPPRKYRDQSELSALQDISKMVSEKWWYNKLSKIRKIMREHLAIAMGQVSSKASPYASWDCVREHQEQQTRNWQFIKQGELFDEETEEVASLEDMVVKSVSNPAIRRHELMTRCRGCEDIGNELGLQGLFLTLTTPSKYHNSYKKGGFIDHWNGASPRDAQAYLNNVWQRTRAKLGRQDIRWFGVRVAEPHHDGTPHWHLLIWVKPEQVEQAVDIFVDYATQEDPHELVDKKGNYDHSPRCDVEKIDPEKGTATGYIAKYISKNIDGYAMDDEVSDETGESIKTMAKNVSAWKSRWCIRQFQFFGGAPVTTYRELRRFANQNKKQFMEYLFMQERVDLLTIYSMLMRDQVGPIKPSKLISNEELLKVIGDHYQARTKTEEVGITDTLKAADQGNWQGYIMGQGGPFVKREDLLIVNTYEELPFASPHGETVRKIKGFATGEESITTRTKVWTIRKKEPLIDEGEANTQGSGATAFGASGSSRSSVNNCTPEKQVQVSNQLTRLLEPDKNHGEGPPNYDEVTLNALLKGHPVRIDQHTSIKIRPAEVDEHGDIRPAQLVEQKAAPVEHEHWQDFPGWEAFFAQPETQTHQQPNLSIFPDGDDWPLI